MATAPLNAVQTAWGGKKTGLILVADSGISSGRIHFIERDAGKTAGDIAGLHETTIYNLHLRLAPRDGIDIGVDEVTGGANIPDGAYRRKKSR